MNSQSILCCYRDSIRLAFTIAAFTALLLTVTGQSQAQTGYDARAEPKRLFLARRLRRTDRCDRNVTLREALRGVPRLAQLAAP